MTQKKESMSNSNRQTGMVREQINKHEDRLNEIKARLKSLYEDKCKGELDADTLSELMADFTKERDNINTELPRLRREYDSIMQAKGDVEEWLSLAESCISFESLDRYSVDGLIDSITVTERVKEDGKATQEVFIKYRFTSEMSTKGKEDIAS